MVNKELILKFHSEGKTCQEIRDLLGDMCLSTSSKFHQVSITHGGNQEEYFDHKCKIFSNILGKLIKLLDMIKELKSIIIGIQYDFQSILSLKIYIRNYI